MMISHRAKKSLGQNFLMHARIAERIADVARLTPDATVLEIGPGTGMLTRELLKKAAKVIAIEADQELFEKLQTDFASEISSGNLELIPGDIREWFASSYNLLPTHYHLVSNIPYYLTGELFRLFLTAPHQPSSITFLVQKEVAERIARSKKESILSLSVKAYGTPKYEFTVKRGAFNPAPKVDSAVLTISDISRDRFSAGGGPASGGKNSKEMEEKFFALIHAGFAHKRKFVRKNLLEAGLLSGDIPEKARAEDLPLTTWSTLSKSEY